MSVGHLGAVISDFNTAFSASYLLPTIGIFLLVLVTFPSALLFCKGQVLKSVETFGHSIVAFCYLINPFGFVIGIRRTWHIWVAIVLTSSENSNAQ
jgi:hypothetical protein